MKKLSIMWVLIILFGYYTVCFSCVEEERIGLLKLKPIFGNVSRLSWVDSENSNCCGWESVKCDNTTGRVEQLDLSNSYPPIDLLVLDASLFLPFQQLQYLDISNNFFDLKNDQDLGSLKKLQVLSLNYNNFNNASIFQSLSPLTSLIVLDLSDNKVNGSLSNLGRGLCKLKNLQELHLSRNLLSGSIPACFNNLTSLRVLDLSHNNLFGNIDSSLLVSLPSLEVFSINKNLQLDGNLMFNSLAGSHREFQLKYLSLSNCKLNISTADLLKNLHNLPNLIELDLSHNNLHGEFPNSFFKTSSWLQFLNLKNNSLTGHIHLPVGPLVNLEWFDVSHNHIQGELQPNIGEVSPKLEGFYIANNDLGGEIPISLGNMKDLKILDFRNNNLSGKLPQRLDLSCQKLAWIRLSNNSLEGQIPDTILNLTNLGVLDLGNNHFTGYIPSKNFQSFYLTTFDVSQNNISGRIPPWLGTNVSLVSLSMQDNSLEGYIPPELCNLTILEYLDLSGNQLSGPMPSCLTIMESLAYLHLQRNKLTGPLSNVLPPGLWYLLIIDLSHNDLSGRIPKWFEFFLNLRVLLLKGNHFSGSIPRELCRLQKIGIMDLSHNNLSGSIPVCFTNITFGKIANDEISGFGHSLYLGEMSSPDEGMFQDLKSNPTEFGYDDYTEEKDYPDDVEFMTKSRSYSYKGEIINYMSGLDLSCNHLKGNIPLDIGALTDIRALNLSHNKFTGVIPPSLSNMKQIESIDLSNNKLSGEIPSSLTRLFTLAVFTVAYNNLSGRVPEMVAQFSTFNETSYEGNPFLCGPPLLEHCKNITDQVTTTSTLVGRNDVFGIDPICFLASFAATYMTCLMGFVIVLCINPYWRRRWFYFIDTCLGFIFPSWY